MCILQHIHSSQQLWSCLLCSYEPVSASVRRPWSKQETGQHVWWYVEFCCWVNPCSGSLFIANSKQTTTATSEPTLSLTPQVWAARLMVVLLWEWGQRDWAQNMASACCLKALWVHRYKKMSHCDQILIHLFLNESTNIILCSLWFRHWWVAVWWTTAQCRREWCWSLWYDCDQLLVHSTFYWTDCFNSRHIKKKLADTGPCHKNVRGTFHLVGESLSSEPTVTSGLFVTWMEHKPTSSGQNGFHKTVYY